MRLSLLQMNSWRKDFRLRTANTSAHRQATTGMMAMKCGTFLQGKYSQTYDTQPTEGVSLGGMDLIDYMTQNFSDQTGDNLEDMTMWFPDANAAANSQTAEVVNTRGGARMDGKDEPPANSEVEPGNDSMRPIINELRPIDLRNRFR